MGRRRLALSSPLTVAERVPDRLGAMMKSEWPHILLIPYTHVISSLWIDR